ncbi:hypothetical protein ABIA32_006273 [Streptacidiphilus sp. MAP12-20]|uniref:hypothetical protein n=1 Tax=Streptacidiphilus sp. MAP12-20 TaxID=3156299 RepID=UPI0035189102
MPSVRRRSRPVAYTLALVGALTLGLSACSSTSTSNNFSGSTTSALGPATGASGVGPSALKSLASAGVASAASASASNAAQASAFASSAAAQAAQNAALYRSELSHVTGRGDAVSDVQVTGVPKAETGGLHAVIVNITNRSRAEASYAVQIDFTDPAGHVIDTDIVGTQHLAPGAKATPVAFSTKDAALTLIPVIAKAQRF